MVFVDPVRLRLIWITRHIDQNDFSVQYALSVGDFTGGGELCVEESPSKVRVLQTQNRLVCIDGRFPHWVSGYRGERPGDVWGRTGPCGEGFLVMFLFGHLRDPEAFA